MKLATYSKGIADIDILPTVVGKQVVLLSGNASNDKVDGYLGWGRKKSGHKAAQAAVAYKKPVWFLEDGFVGYWGHPSGRNTRLSLSLDKQGVYYDASAPSTLESMLASENKLSPVQEERAEALRQSLLSRRISKYNHHTSHTLTSDLQMEIDRASYVCLVVDQTHGDQSIHCGGASEESFQTMLQAAQAENPNSLILIKTHPDVLLGKKRSAIGYRDIPGVLWVTQNLHPHALIDEADKVYVVTSQLGFEALWFEKTVVCFGVPFYAGWGLTDDRGDVPDRRNHSLSVNQLVHASLIDYPVYVHPDTGEECEPEDAIDWVAQQQRGSQTRFKQMAAVGFSIWKRAWLAAYTRDIAEQLEFVSEKKMSRHDSGTPLLVWGAGRAEKIREQYPDHLVFTMEDGFVRSAGLGTDLKRPSSLIIDRVGIYYNSCRESELENKLNACDVTDEQKELGREIVKSLVSNGTTKYNVGEKLDDDLSGWLQQSRESNKEIILVPGQVETDASIEYGSPEIKTNLTLLQQVRAEFPNAVVLYKPHPDIVANNRRNKIDFSNEASIADKLIIDANIAQLYSQVDRVCTLTSLSGFEAMMRGIKVNTYGLPFYAGWGLTTDLLTCPRRQNQLSVEELVYVSLVEYPRYVNWETWNFCSVQTVMQQLAEVKTVKTGSNFLSRLTIKLSYFLESWQKG